MADVAGVFKMVVERVRKRGKHAVGSEYTRYFNSESTMQKYFNRTERATEGKEYLQSLLRGDVKPETFLKFVKKANNKTELRNLLRDKGLSTEDINHALVFLEKDLKTDITRFFNASKENARIAKPNPYVREFK